MQNYYIDETCENNNKSGKNLKGIACIRFLDENNLITEYNQFSEGCAENISIAQPSEEYPHYQSDSMSFRNDFISKFMARIPFDFIFVHSRELNLLDLYREALKKFYISYSVSDNDGRFIIEDNPDFEKIKNEFCGLFNDIDVQKGKKSIEISFADYVCGVQREFLDSEKIKNETIIRWKRYILNNKTKLMWDIDNNKFTPRSQIW